MSVSFKKLENMNAPALTKRLLPAWLKFQSLTDVAPIRDENHYQTMLDLLDILMDETRGQSQHPLSDLADIVGLLVHDY